jgi:putative addiction module component (TIGR02574 family)
MNARTAELMDEALALDPQERSVLMIALLDSLEGEDEALVSQAWAAEIRQRKERLRNGTDKAIAWSQVRAEIDAL